MYLAGVLICGDIRRSLWRQPWIAVHGADLSVGVVTIAMSRSMNRLLDSFEARSWVVRRSNGERLCADSPRRAESLPAASVGRTSSRLRAWCIGARVLAALLTVAAISGAHAPPPKRSLRRKCSSIETSDQSFPTNVFSATGRMPRSARRTCGSTFVMWPSQPAPLCLTGQRIALCCDASLAPVTKTNACRPASAKVEGLSEAEVQTLRRWIEQGAEYEDHWSFIPLRPVEVPDNGAATPIDALIQDGIARLGLAQQPEVDRHTLIRRVTFDLTGLPPSPAEIEAFVT